MSEWISVKDRLPEDVGNVIVAVRHIDRPMEGWYSPRLGWRVIDWDWKRDNHVDVTHWMPFPKMPEEQHEI